MDRDNLRIKTIAKWKTLRDGDINMYTEIENNLLDLASIKGKAFSDSSMEEKERSIESDLEKRGLSHPDTHYGRQSENSERIGSVLSEDNFWQTLELGKKKSAPERTRTLIAKKLTNAEELKNQNAIKR